LLTYLIGVEELAGARCRRRRFLAAPGMKIIEKGIDFRTVAGSLWSVSLDWSSAEEADVTRAWEADPAASLSRRLGRSAAELGTTGGRDGCPDIWELDNGDIAVIGRDLTGLYASRLPAGVNLAADERMVIIPRRTLVSAKADIPDA
jgi:hypothetical protein